MRKHHKRWVALIGAAAIASSGWVSIPAVADEKDTRTVTGPEDGRDASPYSLDGYGIGYLPAGLERYGVSSSTVADRLGNRQSQLSWMRGPGQLLGRVSVLRSDRYQSLDDLREHRYGHLPERTLERLASGEALRNEAYLSPETGDLFWMEEPGVAVSVYLQPDRWGSGELVRMAESLTELKEGSPEEPATEGAEEPTAEEPTVEEPSQEGGASETAEEGTGGAAGGSTGATGQEEPAEEGGDAQKPAAEAGEEATSVDGVTDGTTVGTSPVGRPETPETHNEIETSEASETSDTPGVTAGGEEDASQEKPDAEEPAGSEQTEETRVRQAKECVIHRFVDFGTGETSLAEAGMTPSSKEFVERTLALALEELSDEERDRLLATIWYYGDEGAKAGAVDDCARTLDMTRGEVETVIYGLASVIAELVEAAEQHEATHDETVARTLDVVEDTLPVEPIGAAEWEEMVTSLPWSLPTGAS
ncbi:hypothetical protein [Nocardiopsis halotolerans]|uniref:hypothetical protein n=1 Tax=Nocardiopsis halotolerans TaxID=124252 RepID=UPI000348AAFB|nr:hypothetical protein [Nocardiopsis halotolerans]